MLRWISGWKANTRDQSGCSSKEYQYRWDCTSQLAPG